MDTNVDITPYQESAGGSLKGKKIMWVEDDKFLNDIIVRKLSTLECTLVHANNGDEAFTALEKEVPDIIILDIMLPGMDGFEILKRIRENPKYASLPVIILSNLGQDTDIQKGKELNATRFLVKATVNLDEIVAEIADVLQKEVK